MVLSPAYRFLSPDTPLRHPAAVTVRTRVPRRLQFRTALAVRNRKGRLAWVGGSYANGTVTASTYATGDLVAVADTLAPAVRPLFAEGADLSKSESLRFRAADNFSGIASWTLRIDGEWVPCDRFPVKGTLVHFFDAPPQRRRHDVQLSVSGGSGSISSFGICLRGRVRRFPAFVRAGTIWIKKADRTNLRPVFSGKRAVEASI